MGIILKFTIIIQNPRIMIIFLLYSKKYNVNKKSVLISKNIAFFSYSDV